MRNRIISGSVAAAAGLLLCLASPARAEEQREYNEFEFTPFLGQMAGGEFEDPTDDSDRDLDADTDFGIFVDAATDWWRHYEMLYVSQSTRVKGATPFDMDVQYLQFGGTVAYPDSSHRVVPYFGMTVGAARFSPDGSGLDDETKFAFTIGGGVRVPITDHFGVRLDLRAFGTVLDSESDLFCVSDGGLTCRIKAKGDFFLQYAANLGVIIGF
ncbi:MAG TPA: outer membrane beta-barrel protein [Steroidobacteraceae bacterium]|jgi:opacity protein-like surface antigen|nr:outer membrane beta-barrel protein [Steroidobacteraceae bacterium]